MSFMRNYLFDSPAGKCCCRDEMASVSSVPDSSISTFRNNEPLVTPTPVPSILTCGGILEEKKEPTFRELVAKVAEMDSVDGYLKSNFVIEECAELIVEMARTYRENKTTNEKIFGEACDVLATTFVVLYSLGYNEDEVRECIKFKYKRALELNAEKDGSNTDD